MEFLINQLSSVFFLIVPFLVLLGVVIVIHEFGHFAAAKLLGVKVEVFSVGFGKKILKYKYGDTVYCLSLFILGGYVKLFGDEPGKEMSEEEKKYSFLHKPILSKVAIAFAGPFMNFILAIFLFFILSLYGEFYPSPEVGDIRPFSKAYNDGFRSGDRIEEINQEKVKTWAQVEKIVQRNPNENLEFKVKRKRDSGDFLVHLKSKPILRKNNDISSFKSKVGSIEGLSAFSKASYVSLSDAGWAEEVGFRSFDKILSINDKEVRYWRNITEIISSELALKNQLTIEVKNEIPPSLVSGLSSSKKESLKKDVHTANQDLKNREFNGKKRNLEKKSLDNKRGLTFDFKSSAEKTRFLNSFRRILKESESTEEGEKISAKDKVLNLEKREELLLDFLGLKSTELFLLGVKKASPADKAGLKIGDWILSINEKPVRYWYQIEQGIQEYDPKSKTPVKISVLRNGEVFSYELIPESKKIIKNHGTYASQERQYIIGVSYMNTMIMAKPVFLKERNIFKAMFNGFNRTIYYTVSISANIGKIIQAKISPKNIAGPITIGRVASRVFKVGFAAFIKLMALISINLGLVNLLPIPMLDGGHILFFTIEGLKGRPISLKQLEIAQQVGFIFLILLIGLAFYNDIMNLFQPLF